MNSTLTPLGQIKPNPNNPRTIKDVKYKKLVESIRTFPKMLELRPIVVNDDMIVLGGNMRLKACKEAGIKEVPVIKASDLTEEEQRQFIIKDNVGYGEWDWEMLANEWDVAELDDWGMDLPKDMFEPTIDTSPDEYIEPERVRTTIVEGDMIEIGPHRLFCSDSTISTEVDKLMNSQKANMVFTDPPYALFGNSTGVHNVNDDSMAMPFFVTIFEAIRSHTILFSHVYVCCDWHSAFSLQKAFTIAELTPKNLIVWDKGDGGLGTWYQQCHELIWLMTHSPIETKVMGKTITGERPIMGRPNIWRHNRTSDKHHTAQKPLEMVSNAIDASSGRGDIVLDLFLGSGTTMLASAQIGRTCFGMEKEPRYCQIIINRMIEQDPTLEVKINGKIWERQIENSEA